MPCIPAVWDVQHSIHVVPFFGLLFGLSISLLLVVLNRDAVRSGRLESVACALSPPETPLSQALASQSGMDSPWATLAAFEATVGEV